MSTKLSLAVGLLVLTLSSAGCGGQDGPTATSDGRADNTVPAGTSVTSAIPSTTTTASSRLTSSSRLRIDGIGPIDVGMTVAQARAAAGTELSLRKQPYCDVLTAPNGPAGVDLVITNPSSGRIDLVIVNGGPVATISGIRVGSTEAEVVAAYPGRLRSVNPSLPVHRQVYEAQNPTLADRSLVFVIDGSRVTTIYAGVSNQVEADEICG